MATTHENAQALHHTLAKFGVPLQDVTPKDFENKELFFMIGAPPNRIDILMGIPGVDFEQAWENRVEADIDGINIFYISREDLIASKRAVGRDQNLLDIKILEQAESFLKKRAQLTRPLPRIYQGASPPTRRLMKQEPSSANQSPSTLKTFKPISRPPHRLSKSGL